MCTKQTFGSKGAHQCGALTCTYCIGIGTGGGGGGGGVGGGLGLGVL